MMKKNDDEPVDVKDGTYTNPIVVINPEIVKEVNVVHIQTEYTSHISNTFPNLLEIRTQLDQ